uniref:MADF domain-containing protein n=1 Tax=Anopheles dirus TaxID=7168 RepID=A0A182NWR0_9DIPT
MVRKKWLSLCAYYRKEKAKVKKTLITGSACTDVYNSNWFAFDSMHFLGEITKPRPTQSTQNLSKSQCGVDRTVNSSPEKEHFETANQISAEPSTSRARNEEPPVSHQRKYSNDNVDEHFHEILSSIAKSLEVIISNVDSRNATVGTFVTQTLDKLPKAKQEKLILQINKLIYNISTEND